MRARAGESSHHPSRCSGEGSNDVVERTHEDALLTEPLPERTTGQKWASAFTLVRKLLRDVACHEFRLEGGGYLTPMRMRLHTVWWLDGECSSEERSRIWYENCYVDGAVDAGSSPMPFGAWGRRFDDYRDFGLEHLRHVWIGSDSVSWDRYWPAISAAFEASGLKLGPVDTFQHPAVKPLPGKTYTYTRRCLVKVPR